MQSAVSGLMQAFKAEFSTDGTDWDNIAYGMHLYGSGGISCWGTLCGIPNGCVALLNLIGLHGTALAGEVLGHYSSTEFPTAQIPDLHSDLDYGPGGTKSLPWNWTPIADEDVLAKTTSYSPLCHISISKWCYEAGVHLGSKDINNMVYKNDRCGKICADVTAFTAELINYWALNGAVETPYSLPAETAQCKSCHWKSGLDPEIYPAQCGLMDCQECHTEQIPHMARDMYIDDIWMTNLSDEVKTKFTPGQWVKYHVRFAYLGAGAVWMKTRFSKGYGKDTSDVYWKNTLARDEEMMAAVETWTFTKQIPANAKVSSWCKYYMCIQMLDHEGSSPPIQEATKQIKFKIVP